MKLIHNSKVRTYATIKIKRKNNMIHKVQNLNQITNPQILVLVPKVINLIIMQIIDYKKILHFNLEF